MIKEQLLEHISSLFTKEEVIAMLTEIQLEIEEKFNDRPFSYNHHQRTEFYRDIDEVIQQKINALNGNNEDDTSSIMPDWHIKEIDDKRWSVYTKNYAYRGTFNTKSDAYNYIISNFLHERGIIHVHKIDGAVIEELKFPFRKLPIV